MFGGVGFGKIMGQPRMTGQWVTAQGWGIHFEIYGIRRWVSEKAYELRLQG